MKWIGYLEDRSENLIVVREEEGSWCLGDWCMPLEGYAVEEVDLDKILGSLDPRLVNTCFFHHCCVLAEKAGEALGRETLYFKKLAARIKKNFNKEFYDEKTGRYTNSEFYPNIYPLYFGMVPEGETNRVAKTLADDIIKSDYAMKTGIFATSMVFGVLADNGYGKIIESMLEREEYPSFGHMIKSGATTLWETWDGKASLNHPMFGSVCSFFHRYLAGMRYMSRDGMFLIQPLFLENINELEACHESIYGPVYIKWRRNRGKRTICMEVKLPGNTKGVVKTGESIIKVENGTYKGSFENGGDGTL
jgi:alpha-L-rhamnosidase